jgi:hypothetical protein
MSKTIEAKQIGPLCGKSSTAGYAWTKMPGFPDPVGKEAHGKCPHVTIYDLEAVTKWLKESGKWDMKPRQIRKPVKANKKPSLCAGDTIRQFLTAPSALRPRVAAGNGETVRVRVEGDNGAW